MMPDAKVLLDGQVMELSFTAARAMVQQLVNDAEQHSRDEAERLARAGWLILQFAGDRRYGVYNNLYLKFGVTPQRGKRMRRMAEDFINPATGTFDPEAWRADRAGRNKDKKPRSNQEPNQMAARNHLVRVDPNEKDSGNQSVREDPNKDDDGRVGGRFADTEAEPYDPVQAAIDQLAPPKPRGPKPEFRPGYVAPKATPAGCVGASQPDLPWHLAESARTLAQRAAELEAAVQRGEVDSDFAHGIQARIDELLTDLAAANAGAA